MIPDFLPAEATSLTEATSIALVQAMQRQAIFTSLSEHPILTSVVRQGTAEPPILLLHGFDSSVLEFRRLLPLLAQRHTTWAVDLLGFGFCDRPSDLAYSPAAIKTHLYYVWKTLINQPVILVGASMGGAAAIDVALTYPEMVKQLVLIDSAGFATGSRLAQALFPVIAPLAAEILRSPRVRKRVSLQAYADSSFVTDDALLCASLHLKLPNWRTALASFTRTGGYTFLSEKISHINQPTLILWGEQDRILGREDAERFKHAIADSRLVWVPECGHVPHLEKPQVTAGHILDFIQSD